MKKATREKGVREKSAELHAIPGQRVSVIDPGTPCYCMGTLCLGDAEYVVEQGGEAVATSYACIGGAIVGLRDTPRSKGKK